MTRPQPQIPPPPERVGRYRILGQLAKGGMGYLYLGRAEGPGGFERLVAVKMIHSHLAEEKAFIEMFLDEARIAARIHHPNVVQVQEVEEEDGRFFIAMDYVNGETLARTLSHTWKAGKPFPLDIAAYVAASVAEGLHAAHELSDRRGEPLHIIHRDVSPGNIMVGYDGIVRITDFGIAKAVDRISSTRTGKHKGKVAYMAPERIREHPVDRRVDIFALGVVLWETIVGKRLFKAKTDLATAERVLRGAVPKPSVLREGCPSGLEDVIMKAIRRSRSKRYETARQMAHDLRQYLATQAGFVSAVDVEHFMKDVFPDRHRRRGDLVKHALEDDLTGVDPLSGEDSSSMSGGGSSAGPGSLSEMQMDTDRPIEDDVDNAPTDQHPAPTFHTDHQTMPGLQSTERQLVPHFHSEDLERTMKLDDNAMQALVDLRLQESVSVEDRTEELVHNPLPRLTSAESTKPLFAPGIEAMQGIDEHTQPIFTAPPRDPSSVANAERSRHQTRMPRWPQAILVSGLILLMLVTALMLLLPSAGS